MQAGSVVDDYSYLPAAVRDQALRSDELLRQIYQGETQAASAANAETPAEVQPSASPVAANSGDYEKLQHSMSVLRGKYNAETARMSSEIHYLREQLTSLRQKLEGERDNLDNDSGEENPEHQNQGYSLDTIRDVVGDDTVGYLGQLESKVKSKIEELNNKVEMLEEQSLQASKDKFFAQVSAIVPGWEQINQSEGFLNWLQQVDPYTGISLQEHLTNAAKELKADRAASFFRDYLATMQQANPAPQQQVAPVQKVEQVATRPSDKLASLIQPDAAGAGSAIGGDKKIWSAAEVRQFYQDCTKGSFRGRENEMDRIDKEIVLAGAENRIR